MSRPRACRAARKALGPDIEIAVDAHGTYTVAEAKRFAHMVEDCDLAWFEEPVTADDKPGMAEVRAATCVPIATGESEATRFDFRDLAVMRCADILQPDPAFCGGITETMRIAALAASFNLRFAPHLWAGAPCFFAGLHLLRRQPRELHHRIFLRRQSDDPRPCRRMTSPPATE